MRAKTPMLGLSESPAIKFQCWLGSLVAVFAFISSLSEKKMQIDSGLFLLVAAPFIVLQPITSLGLGLTFIELYSNSEFCMRSLHDIFAPGPVRVLRAVFVVCKLVWIAWLFHHYYCMCMCIMNRRKGYNLEATVLMIYSCTVALYIFGAGTMSSDNYTACFVSLSVLLFGIDCVISSIRFKRVISSTEMGAQIPHTNARGKTTSTEEYDDTHLIRSYKFPTGVCVKEVYERKPDGGWTVHVYAPIQGSDTGSINLTGNHGDGKEWKWTGLQKNGTPVVSVVPNDVMSVAVQVLMMHGGTVNRFAFNLARLPKPSSTEEPLPDRAHDKPTAPPKEEEPRTVV